MDEEKKDNQPWVDPRPCMSEGHEFPSHLYIPPGQTYKHVCPGCQREIVITTPQIW